MTRLDNLKGGSDPVALFQSIPTVGPALAQRIHDSLHVDTLESLRKRLDGHIQLRLLLGTDHLQTFHRWRNPKRVVELAQPLVMVRPPDTRSSLLAALPSQNDRQQWADRFVDVPRIDVSSTHIRHLAAQHQSIQGLVTPTVEAYITQHRLYEASHGGRPVWRSLRVDLLRRPSDKPRDFTPP